MSKLKKEIKKMMETTKKKPAPAVAKKPPVQVGPGGGGDAGTDTLNASDALSDIDKAIAAAEVMEKKEEAETKKKRPVVVDRCGCW